MNDSTTFRRVPVYAFRRESDDFLAGVIGSPTSAIDNCQSFVTTARKYIRMDVGALCQSANRPVVYTRYRRSFRRSVSTGGGPS